VKEVILFPQKEIRKLQNLKSLKKSLEENNSRKSKFHLQNKKHDES
jgi:hypothetical protein